jgi:hypothetical protein
MLVRYAARPMNNTVAFLIYVALYLIVQVVAGIRCRGGLRVAALVPLAWMGPLTVVTARWIRESENLSPCLWIPVGVLTVAFQLCLLVAALSRREPESKGQGFEVLPPRQ